ncbi:MAG: hypothetical protein H6713_27545 [Myxococcales bacterium]|nr:hypothetical protein [Myxococcales bacterium]
MAEVVGARLRVSPGEAHALEILDVMCRGRGLRVRAKAPLELRAEVVEIAAQRMAVTCLRFLRDTGGREERTVLRGGRRRVGRLWDSGLAPAFRLRFTAASHQLWWELTQRLEGLSRQSLARVGERATREARRVIRRVVQVPGTDTGDWLLYTLTWRHLHVLQMMPEVRGDLVRRMALGSPLLALATLRAEVPPDIGELGRSLARLLEPSAVRMLECVDELLVEGWTGEVMNALRSANTEEFTARFDAIALTLETYLEVLDRARRLDLARALMRFVAGLATEVFTGDVDSERRRALIHHSPSSIAERDALLARVARVVAFAERLQEVRGELALERYGDDRYEEARIVLADAERLLDPHYERLSALRVGLSGALR